MIVLNTTKTSIKIIKRNLSFVKMLLMQYKDEIKLNKKKGCKKYMLRAMNNSQITSAV